MIQKMVSFDDVIKEKTKEHNPKCPYRTFLIIHTE